MAEAGSECPMERRFYNEHLLHPDPLSAASKSTRYRALKRRKLSVQNAEKFNSPADCSLDAAPGHIQASDMDPEEYECPEVISGGEISDASIEEDDEQFATENEYSDGAMHDVDVAVAVDTEQLPASHFSDEDQNSTASSSQTVLFQNCPLSMTSSLLLIKKFRMRHNLTQEALSDLLKLMRLHFPTPNLLPRWLYLFNKQLPLLRDPLEFTHFCSRCLQEISSRDESVCTNVSCGCSLSGPGAISSFIEVPLEPQLFTILQSMVMNLPYIAMPFALQN